MCVSLAFCLLLACASALDIAGPTTEPYPFITALGNDLKYFMYWKYNATHITIETHCKERGYNGFGFSLDGRMYPGDLVIGYVTDDGQGHLYDYHTFSHKPILDTVQNWNLLDYRQDDSGTMLKFVRAFDTKDVSDWKIFPGANMHLIWSYSDTDPTDPSNPPYHGDFHRGSKSHIMVYGPHAVGK